MPNIAAGTLDRRIEIEVAIQTEDDAGDPIPSWTLTLVRWARKRDSRGREFFGAQQQVHEADTMWTVRSDSDTRLIAPESHRIVYQNRIYEIVAIAASNERSDALEIMCTTRPDQVGERAPLPETSGAST